MKCCAGIDIGGTNTVVGLVDEAGTILATVSCGTRDCPTPELYVEQVVTLIRQLVGTTYTLIGVGIGAPNGNIHTGSIEFAPNMPWQGKIPLALWFEQALQVPVILTNDANAAAIGENYFGAAKGISDFLVVTLGTGVGSGFVVNGELMYGHDGMAGELGHVVIERNGRACGCGRKGCLETYTSATGVARSAQEALEEFSEDSLLRSRAAIGEITSKDVAEAAAQGDLMALDILDDTAEKLGFALANAVAISSPSHIFLYGGLAKSGDLLLRPLREYFETHLLPIYRSKVTILLSGLPDDAAVLGAAALAWKRVG